MDAFREGSKFKEEHAKAATLHLARFMLIAGKKQLDYGDVKRLHTEMASHHGELFDKEKTTYEKLTNFYSKLMAQDLDIPHLARTAMAKTDVQYTTWVIKMWKTLTVAHCAKKRSSKR